MLRTIATAVIGLAFLGLIVLQFRVQPIDDDPGHQKAIIRGHAYMSNLHRQ